MKFEMRNLKGRHDIYYVDEDKECFIVGCNSKSNAKLIAKVLQMDAERMVCDSFQRKTEEIQTHMEGVSNGNNK